MKSIFRTMLLTSILFVVAVSTASGATVNAVYYGHSGEIFLEGTNTIGDATTIAERIAVPDDGKFVQMGPESMVVLKFPGYSAAFPDGTTAADLQINIYDSAFRADAEVLVSLDGTNWTSAGVFSDTANIDLDLIGPIKYVKVDQALHYIDPAYPSLGFDLDAVVALNSGTLPYAKITNPAPNVTVSGDVSFEAIYWDDDPSGVLWAVRSGTCAAATNTVIGNVDGFNTPFYWDGHDFHVTADTSTWEDGEYCFVFNPTESGGEPDIRETQFNVVSNNLPPSVKANGAYSGEILSVVPIKGTAIDPDNDPLTYKWTVSNTHCTIEDPTLLSTNVTCSDVGTFTLTLTVSDGQAAPVSDTATINVTDPNLKTKVEDCVPSTYERYNLVETKFVSSYGSGAITPVITSTTLDPAAKYLIEASGVYYAGGIGVYDIRADAKYNQDAYERYTNPEETWSDGLRNYDTYGPGLLDLKVDGDYVDWGDYSPEHIYTMEKLGTGSSLSLEFQIYDIFAQNNTGGLCVAIYKFENEAPVADPGGPYLTAVNTDLTFDGSGSSDPDVDPLTYLWSFGDSTNGNGKAPTHSYATAGIYDVCLTVNDGYVDSETACTFAVVYDPSAGFVTGGGWIISPEGAYTADPSLTGKATFGFVAKYKKGTTVPDGNTEFQFKTGDLNFKSTSYDWLVVAGTKAQYKGEGTINGQGTYKFMITADDDSTDTFRIKIWTEVDGDDTVVYDNGSQQPLGGGSIVIHK